MKVHSGYLDNVLPPAIPTDPRLSFPADDILYDCRTIGLKSYESALFIFLSEGESSWFRFP